MIDKVRWGILGTANIALAKVIPAMQRSPWCEIRAIASRDLAKAQRAAAELNIPHAYGSYEELLADNTVEAIYNPLPNHLHVPWSIKATDAGKHVLCEKPIALSATEARTLIEARDREEMLRGWRQAAKRNKDRRKQTGYDFAESFKRLEFRRPPGAPGTPDPADAKPTAAKKTVKARAK